MKNTQFNLAATRVVAEHLADLNDEVIYVGGSVVSLYVNDPAAEEARYTEDIDLTFEILSITDLESLRIKLVERGFKQAHQDEVICRFRLNDIKVDVMSTNSVGWAPSNPWFEKGFKASIKIEIDDLSIKILTLPYFLCTKFSAFENRGSIDPLGSHDLEDIIYLFNNTIGIENEIARSDSLVKNYLKQQLTQLLNHKDMPSLIEAHLPSNQSAERMAIILERIKKILGFKETEF